MSDNGRFHDARHYTDVDVKKPDFFMTEKLIKQAKNENWREYATEVEQLARKYNIDKVVNRLRDCSEILKRNDIELPIIKPTFWQKLKREYVHSFDTIHDFENDIQPLLVEKQADDLKIEQEKNQQARQAEIDHLQKIENDRRDAEFREKLRQEKELKEKRYEQERRERNQHEYLRRQELENQQKNESKEPKKPKDDNNNDYTPW